MKFNQNTMQILRNFSSINKSIQFTEGNVLRTMHSNRTVLAKAVLEDTVDSDFAIYELSRLLGVVSMFEDPEFVAHENYLEIKANGRSVKYGFADPSTLNLPPNKDIAIDSYDVEFDLTHDDFSEVLKAVGVMGFGEVVVAGEDGKIVLRGTDVKNVGSDKYDVIVGETDKEFNAVFRVDNLRLMPLDYHVGISSRGLSHFKGDNLEYWVSIESNSNFG